MKSIVRFSKEVVKRLFFGGGSVVLGIAACVAIMSWSSLYVLIAATMTSIFAFAGGVMLIVGGFAYLFQGEDGLG